MVYSIRRSAAKRRMRAMAIVPRRKISKLAQKRSSPERHQRQPRDALLEREDQSLDHGDAAVLTDGAEPRAYALLLAPWFEFLACKLGALIGDQVAGRDACGMDGAAQKGTHRLRSCLSGEKRDAHDPP